MSHATLGMHSDTGELKFEKVWRSQRRSFASPKYDAEGVPNFSSLSPARGVVSFGVLAGDAGKRCGSPARFNASGVSERATSQATSNSLDRTSHAPGFECDTVDHHEHAVSPAILGMILSGKPRHYCSYHEHPSGRPVDRTLHYTAEPTMVAQEENGDRQSVTSPSPRGNATSRRFPS